MELWNRLLDFTLSGPFALLFMWLIAVLLGIGLYGLIFKVILG